MTERSPQRAYFWLLDLRNEWVGKDIDDGAPSALLLISETEATKARNFHFLKDAKLSLGSSLLKRLFAVTAAPRRTSWTAARFGRSGDPKHGKPCLLLDGESATEASHSHVSSTTRVHPSPATATPTKNEPNGTHMTTGNGSNVQQTVPELDFNISHQAGLVALAGFAAADTYDGSSENHVANGTHNIPFTPQQPQSRITSVGVDIVCVNERNDTRTVARDGIDAWVNMHSEVFSDADVRAMKAPLPHGSVNDDPTDAESPSTQAKLRRFYAYWALKEAYVKMVGEGLLADWLRDVEFRGVRVPAASEATEASTGVAAWGETTGGIEVLVRGRRREEVEMFLQAYGDKYMIATAVTRDDAKAPLAFDSPQFRLLNLQRDVFPAAE